MFTFLQVITDILSKINFEIFGVGVLVFVILTLWLKKEIKSNEEKQIQLEKANEKLLEFSKKQFETDVELNKLLITMNDLLSNVSDDIRQTASFSSETDKNHHNNLVVMINDVKAIMMQILNKL